MNDKPKDRPKKWMKIIAFNFGPLIVFALAALIYVIVTGDHIGPIVFFLLCLVSLAIALRWKAVGGVFFVLIGLLFVYFRVGNIITYGIESLIEEIFYFVCGGLLPIIVGLLFLAIWRRKRKAKVSTRSD